MKLRIISGSLKGRTITGPDTDLSFRPTLERTRQSIADMISQRCYGAVAADICAGSGAFGFEMLSRGALSVDFVENNRARVDLIRVHAEKFGVLQQCRVFKKNAVDFFHASDDQYEIVFFDPPYDDAVPEGLVKNMTRRLKPGGVLLYQRRRLQRNAVDARPENERPDEIKTFGDTIVEIYTMK
jgi:16S rRNA (guanine966-N2)-methyltransferase